MTEENDDMLDLDRTPVPVERWILQAVLDTATQSMDFGSGFLVDKDVIALRSLAEVLGVDPQLATPFNFACQYGAEHQWTRLQKQWGATRDHWLCTLCRHTSATDPTTGELDLFPE